MAENGISIKIVNDNTKETMDLFNQRCETALKSVGGIAIDYAQLRCPVDTARLKNSLTYAVGESQGGQNSNVKAGEVSASPSDYTTHSKPKKNVCVIGTNVEYAEPQENKHHYLRDAAGNHTAQYKSLIHDILDE